eukprot:3142198-Pleurochrysis_carterae.AAC.4
MQGLLTVARFSRSEPRGVEASAVAADADAAAVSIASMSVIGGISRALFPQALREELLPKAEKMVEAIADGGESGKQKVPSSGGKPGEGSSFFVELVALLLMAVLGIVNTASGATVIFAGVQAIAFLTILIRCCSQHTGKF